MSFPPIVFVCHSSRPVACASQLSRLRRSRDVQLFAVVGPVDEFRPKGVTKVWGRLDFRPHFLLTRDMTGERNAAWWDEHIKIGSKGSWHHIKYVVLISTLPEQD